MDKKFIESLKDEKIINAVNGMDADKIKENLEHMGLGIDQNISNEKLEESLKIGTQKIKNNPIEEISETLSSVSGGNVLCSIYSSAEKIDNASNNLRKSKDKIYGDETFKEKTEIYAKNLAKDAASSVLDKIAVDSMYIAAHPIATVLTATALTYGGVKLAKLIKENKMLKSKK